MTVKGFLLKDREQQEYLLPFNRPPTACSSG